jgi:histidinol phosphatase-like PHP family hydrolase
MDDYHIHTKATDGKADPAQTIKLARQLKVDTIAFTEHISKTPTYNWFELRETIRNLDFTGVDVLIGVEAKVLNASGDLNVDRDVFNAADLVLGACHGAGSVKWLLDSECDIIAHPQIDNTNVEQFIDCPKVLEINSKHRLPFEILDKLILDTSNIFSFGSDTHDLNDFVVAQDFFKTVLKKYPKIRLFNRKNVS